MVNISRCIAPRAEGSEGMECVGFRFTDCCNLSCTYCYVQKKSEATIKADVVHRIISTVLGSHGCAVEFYPMGAEPLTRFSLLKEIVEWTEKGCWERPFHFMAATNGTLLNSEMKEWFALHKDVISLGLSIDGDISSQTANRGVSIPEFDFFRTTWPDQPMKMTISEDTAASVDKDVIFLHEHGVNFTANAAYEAKTWSPDNLLKYEQGLYRLADYYAEHPEIRPCNLFAPLPEYAVSDTGSIQPCYCSAGTTFEFYDMDGKCYPCHMLSPLVLDSEQCANASERFSRAKESGDYSDHRCRECIFKASCFTCMGSNELYRNDIRSRDALHCKIYCIQMRANVHMWARKFIKNGCTLEQQRKRLAAMDRILEYLDGNPVSLS